MKQPPGYMTYREAAIMFTLMDDADAAAALKAIANYYLYQTEPEGLTGVAQRVFETMKADIDRDTVVYTKKIEAQRENAKKRWEKK